MNTKKGKKSRPSKPTNLVPPPTENVTPEENKLDEISVEKLESELKCDEKSPEAVSEVPAVEEKVDTPKKPKRNRGKKKKHDKDEDIVEDQEERVQETATAEAKVVETVKDGHKVEKDDKVENVKNTEIVPEVTPTARKKKNKKKDKNNDATSQGEECKEIPEDKAPITLESSLPDTKIEALESTEQITEPKISIVEQEFQSPKKKNKKKKRQDSEKSEPTDDTASCTSAFQKLLQTETSAQEQISDDKKEEKPVENLLKNTDKLIEEPESVDISKNKNEIELTEVKDKQETKEVEKEEMKSKKKNKKEKKHPSKTDIDTSDETKLPLPKEEAEIIQSPPPLAEITPPVVPELIQNIEEPVKIEDQSKITQEISPKPKAKIAKPVEKKRKGKEEIKSEESQSDEKKLEKIEPNIQITEIALEATDVKLDTTITPVFEAETKQLFVIEKDIDTADDGQTSNVANVDTQQAIPKTIEDIEVKVNQELKLQEIDKSSLKPASKENKNDKKRQKQNKNTKTTEPTVGETVTTSVIVDNDPKTEADIINPQTDTGNLDSPISETIEISSVKTDEPHTDCETIPDIYHPRASSQQNIDDNNNMVIQEISSDNTKLDLPVADAPLVQNSGETPINTPEIVSKVIIQKEKNTSPEVREEKTDLKSKMMEVNQDMEDLRLSIEKSLAELTALEKTEEVVQQLKIEDQASIKSTDNPPILVLRDDPVKIEDKSTGVAEDFTKNDTNKSTEISNQPSPAEAPKVANLPDKLPEEPPVCPSRKDHKGKGKNKKKGKQDTVQTTALSTTVTATSSTSQTTTASATEKETKETKKEDKPDQKTETSTEKGKQQSDAIEPSNGEFFNTDFEPIENFEDALTSSVDDVNKTFEIIVNENDQASSTAQQTWKKPEINIIAPEDTAKPKDGKINPVSQPKNLLGHTDIPVSSNRTDYKKEKDKTPNTRQARVRIRDQVTLENNKQSKESQTETKRRLKLRDTFSQIVNHNEEYVYKYSFRKVFLQSACHVCTKDLSKNRVPCSYCNLVFYCSPKHKDEDWTQHQALCFAVSTIIHLKNQKHIYADAIDTTGYDYRVIRMQMILSCEKVMKRQLEACEQEMLLYPRLCAAPSCREWRQGKLKDCERCGQISFCTPEHLPPSHARWCMSYDLYRKLVTHQQTLGRLEPKLPTRVIADKYQLPEKMNEVLAAIYEEKIDMNDIQYAALTQIATAPLTAAFCHQFSKKSSFCIHVVNAELQFEADALNKWETFYLHLRPEVRELTLVLIGADLNPSSLPLELLGKIKLCDKCRESKRRVIFSFQDKKIYCEYKCSEDFIYPDLVCAFNASIHRRSTSALTDPWPDAINAILTLKCPFLVTSYTMTEAQRDLRRVIELAQRPYDVITEPKYNTFASVRPDRNFISDNEMPLLFKNYCYTVLCGA